MNWIRIFKLVNVLIALVMLSACSSEASLKYADKKSDFVMLKKIEQQYQVWNKTPYRYGGNTLNGVDCSAFVKRFYSDKFNMWIPRVTTDQAKIGVSVSQLQAGDLIFFKTGRGSAGLHVGIYYKNGQFLHASTSDGVRFSNVNDSYWKKHYWIAKRVVS
ncbi:NlpC/P60 family protein [Orbus hercynius]|nr:NlpC/P60 family protein [Orbus hercynius]